MLIPFINPVVIPRNSMIHQREAFLTFLVLVRHSLASPGNTPSNTDWLLGPRENGTHLERRACGTLVRNTDGPDPGGVCSKSHPNREGTWKAVQHKGKIIPHLVEITSNCSQGPICNPSSFLVFIQLLSMPHRRDSSSRATNAQFIREQKPCSCAISPGSSKGLNINRNQRHIIFRNKHIFTLV